MLLQNCRLVVMGHILRLQDIIIRGVFFLAFYALSLVEINKSAALARI